MENHKKILVVGAGLAGVCVSYHLLEQGCSVTLIDNEENHSSLVAAGMITPLVFRRMNKSWRADDFLDYLISFYTSIEKETNRKILAPVPLRRMFSSEQERNYWLSRQNQSEYSRYMTEVSDDDDKYSLAINNFGSGRVKHCYAVDASVFLPEMKKIIMKKGSLLREQFDHSLLVGRTYKGIEYSDIVFCEGYMNKHNPWFGHLPIDQTKGEVLTVRAASIPSGESLNRKCFMLPLGDHVFKVGSTYDWGNPDITPTEKGKMEILENLSYITKEEVSVLDHYAGVRPTTMDRRPIIGTHHESVNYHIFNGLGAKGFMSAPLLSKEFAEYLCNQGALSSEVDLHRYLHK